MSTINPHHYRKHKIFRGVECIDVTHGMSFLRGNAVKYLWRCTKKHDSPCDDLHKALWYLLRDRNSDVYPVTQPVSDELWFKMLNAYLHAVEALRAKLPSHSMGKISLNYRKLPQFIYQTLKDQGFEPYFSDIADVMVSQAVLLLISPDMDHNASAIAASQAAENALKLYLLSDVEQGN